MRLSAHRHDLGNPVERRLDVAGLFGHQEKAEVLAVRRHHIAEAVDDLPAQGRQHPALELVFLGEVEIFLMVTDLKLVKPPADHRKQGADPAAQHQRPPRDDFLAFRVMGVDAHHLSSRLYQNAAMQLAEGRREHRVDRNGRRHLEDQRPYRQ